LIFPAVTMREVFQPTILLALALMAVIAMMVLPVPAWMLTSGSPCPLRWRSCC
jgi:flagellar biosynthesis protein FlhA